MWIVYQMKHYCDESECKLIAAFKNKKDAKVFAEMKDAEYKYVHYFG